MKNKFKSLLKYAMPLMIALLSIFVLAKPLSSPEFHKETIRTLDAKKSTVLELTAVSTAASAAITFIPGDVATPIADSLAELSTYFLIIVCAIFLEKYLVTISCYVAFYYLIPIACGCWLSFLIFKGNIFKQIAIKLGIFAVCITLIIPTSVGITNLIDSTYQTSIQETIDEAKETSQQVEEESTKGNWLTSQLKKITDKMTTSVNKLKQTLNNLIEAAAVMIVTSCVIPIVIMLCFAWLIKILLGVKIEEGKTDVLPKAPTHFIGTKEIEE